MADDLPLVNLYGKEIKAYINVKNLGIGKRIQSFQGEAKQVLVLPPLQREKLGFT